MAVPEEFIIIQCETDLAWASVIFVAGGLNDEVVDTKIGMQN